MLLASLSYRRSDQDPRFGCYAAEELGFQPKEPEGQSHLSEEKRDSGSSKTGHSFLKKVLEQHKGPPTQHRSGAL